METFGKLLIVVIFITAVALLLGLPLMLLWNWLMPDLFGVKEIGFWQAVGLNFLSSILFKNSPSSISRSNK